MLLVLRALESWNGSSRNPAPLPHLGLVLDPAIGANTGQFQLTGVAAGMVAARLLTASAGSFAETGVAALLTSGRLVTANTGAFTETGVAAVFALARQLTVDAGAYVLTGQDATLTKQSATDKTLTADAGAFSVAGRDAQFATTAQVSQVGHVKRVVYEIEVDGEKQWYDTPAEAEAALRRLRKRVKNVVRDVKRKARHVPLLEQEIRPPAVVSDHDFADKYIAQIHAMFAELEAMRAAELERDDEDVLLLL